jgi:7,8-dihydropterin-6-yl-methyl-4-(beta-D-ribofuranosyl)aminobenzene 5'-phosphate synthase
MKIRSVVSCFIVVVSCSDLSHAASPGGAQSADSGRAQITVLYDAFGRDSTMTKDWGYSALVEVKGKRILFDTGDNPEIFAANVKAKDVDLTRLDFVVMSHRHGDHMGGLTHLLSVNPHVKIYAPKENFGVYGFDLPSRFYRRAESLPPEMRYYDGAPPEIMKFGTAFPSANIQLIDKTTEVSPGITLIALVSDAPGTKELKELSLAINTPEGVVLVVGCAHPGLEAIAAEAARIDPHIHFVAGGFHLVVAPDADIERVAAALHDTFKVDYIAPGHCTGEPTFAALQKAFGDRYLYAGLGTTVDTAANPRASLEAGAIHAMDESDLRGYRALFGQSDDLEVNGFGVGQFAQAQ